MGSERVDLTLKSKLRAQTLTHWQDYWSTQELGPNTSNGHCDYRISALSFGLPWGLSGKEPACNAGDTGEMGLIPVSGSSLGGYMGNLLHYSCRKIPRTEKPGGLQLTGLQRVGQD